MLQSFFRSDLSESHQDLRPIEKNRKLYWHMNWRYLKFFDVELIFCEVRYVLTAIYLPQTRAEPRDLLILLVGKYSFECFWDSFWGVWSSCWWDWAQRRISEPELPQTHMIPSFCHLSAGNEWIRGFQASGGLSSAPSSRFYPQWSQTKFWTTRSRLGSIQTRFGRFSHGSNQEIFCSTGASNFPTSIKFDVNFDSGQKISDSLKTYLEVTIPSNSLVSRCHSSAGDAFGKKSVTKCYKSGSNLLSDPDIK